MGGTAGNGAGSSGANAGNNPGTPGNMGGPGAGNSSGGGGGAAAGAGAAGAAKGNASPGAGAAAAASAAKDAASKSSPSKSTSAVGKASPGAGAGQAAAAAKAAAGKAAATGASNTNKGNASPGAGAGAAAAAAKAAAGGLAKAAAAQGAKSVGAAPSGNAPGRFGALGDVGRSLAGGATPAAAKSAAAANKAGVASALGVGNANPKSSPNAAAAAAARAAGITGPAVGRQADAMARAAAVSRGPGVAGQAAGKGLISNSAQVRTGAETDLAKEAVMRDTMQSFGPNAKIGFASRPGQLAATIAGENAKHGIPGMAAVASQMATRTALANDPQRGYLTKESHYLAASNPNQQTKATVPGSPAFADAVKAGFLGMAPSSKFSGFLGTTSQRQPSERPGWSTPKTRAEESGYTLGHHWGNVSEISKETARQAVAKALGQSVGNTPMTSGLPTRGVGPGPAGVLGGTNPPGSPTGPMGGLGNSMLGVPDSVSARAAAKAMAGKPATPSAQARNAAAQAASQAARSNAVMGAPSSSPPGSPTGPSPSLGSPMGVGPGTQPSMGAFAQAVRSTPMGPPTSTPKSDMGQFGQPGTPMGPQGAFNPGTPAAMDTGRALAGMLSGAMGPNPGTPGQMNAPSAPANVPGDIESQIAEMQNLVQRARERGFANQATPTPASNMGQFGQPGQPLGTPPAGPASSMMPTSQPSVAPPAPPTAERPKPGLVPGQLPAAPPPAMTAERPKPGLVPGQMPAIADALTPSEFQGIPKPQPGEVVKNVEREIIKGLGPNFSPTKAWAANKFGDLGKYGIDHLAQSPTGGWSVHMKDGSVISTDPKTGRISTSGNIPGFPSSESIASATQSLFSKDRPSIQSPGTQPSMAAFTGVSTKPSVAAPTGPQIAMPSKPRLGTGPVNFGNLAPKTAFSDVNLGFQTPPTQNFAQGPRLFGDPGSFSTYGSPPTAPQPPAMPETSPSAPPPSAGLPPGMQRPGVGGPPTRPNLNGFQGTTISGMPSGMPGAGLGANTNGMLSQMAQAGGPMPTGPAPAGASPSTPPPLDMTPEQAAATLQQIQNGTAGQGLSPEALQLVIQQLQSIINSVAPPSTPTTAVGGIRG